MFWNNNLFKSVRKQTPLIIHDLQALLGRKCWASLSRVEAGKQKPTIEIILLYHIIFDIKLERLLEQEIYRIKKNLITRSLEQIDELRTQPSTVELFDRINYLEKVYEQCQN